MLLLKNLSFKLLPGKGVQYRGGVTLFSASVRNVGTCCSDAKGEIKYCSEKEVDLLTLPAIGSATGLVFLQVWGSGGL
jgi:hypothetical protein